MNKKLIIIGTGGHGRIAIDIAEKLEYNIVGLIDINHKGLTEKISRYEVIGSFQKLIELNDQKDTNVFIALGNGVERREYYEETIKWGYKLVSLIDLTAVISKNAKIGDGVLIAPGVIINTYAQIGNGCVINTGSIVEHEVKIGVFSHIAPGTVIAGRVNIGENVFIGVGSNIIDKINIGNSVIIGAGSVVIKDIDNNKKVVGISRIL